MPTSHMNKNRDSTNNILMTLILHTFPIMIRWGSWVIIAYFAKESLVALAGKTTFANIVVEFSQHYTHHADSLTLSSLLVFVIGLWVRERRLRYQKTKTLGTRILELEKRLDPVRTSSGLTLEGKTNPEDPQ